MKVSQTMLMMWTDESCDCATTPFFIQFEKVTLQLETVVIHFEILANQFEKDGVPFEII